MQSASKRKPHSQAPVVTTSPNKEGVPSIDVDWRRLARTFLVSRALDELEETTLLPQKKILYQFSARGHELGQILLGMKLNHQHDAASGYYRSRPLLLTLGLSVREALAGGMAKAGGLCDGRDIGVVFNFPSTDGCSVLPMAGGVGTQYTTTAGWAHAIRYHAETLKDDSYSGAIGAVLGGDGSIATNGFWAALNIATVRKLPMLFFLEDNGYGLSVPSTVQTPGGNVAKNLEAFTDLLILHADSRKPLETAEAIHQAVEHVRAGKGVVLLRLETPRLSGHSGQDTQTYKSGEFLEDERAKDPLPHLHSFLVPDLISEQEWKDIESEATSIVEQGLA